MAAALLCSPAPAACAVLLACCLPPVRQSGHVCCCAVPIDPPPALPRPPGAPQSELVVFDAQTMSSTPVCRLRLPQRVPLGFHGAWVTQEQLAAQSA